MREDEQERIAGAPVGKARRRTEHRIHAYALHKKVLLVYVASSRDWKAYCVPVPGINHDEEKHMWKDHGNALDEVEARRFWPSLAESFDEEGLRWRR